MDPALADLFIVARLYAEKTGLAEGTVSDRVLHGGNRLRDLREGKGDIGVKRLRTAMLWFSANWPEDAVWPSGVERPDPAVIEPVEATS